MLKWLRTATDSQLEALGPPPSLPASLRQPVETQLDTFASSAELETSAPNTQPETPVPDTQSVTPLPSPEVPATPRQLTPVRRSPSPPLTPLAICLDLQWHVKYDDEEVNKDFCRAFFFGAKNLEFMDCKYKVKKAAEDKAGEEGLARHLTKILATPFYNQPNKEARIGSVLAKERSSKKPEERLNPLRTRSGLGVILEYEYSSYPGGR